MDNREKKGFYSVILNEVKNLDFRNLRSFVAQVDKTFYRHRDLDLSLLRALVTRMTGTFESQ